MTAPEQLARYNVGIAFLVLLAYGSLLIAYALGVSSAGVFLPLATISCTLATWVVVSGIYALLRPVSIQNILKQHAIVLMIGAVSLLGWISFIVITDIPTGHRFSFNPFLFVVSAAYPFYLARQTILFDYIDHWYVNSIHIIVGVVASIVSIAMMYKFFQHM